MTPDLIRKVRDQQFDLLDRSNRLDDSRLVATGPAFIGSVYGNPTVPTTTGVYFSVHPTSLVGTEGEGNPGVLTVDTTRTVLVYVIGPLAPVAGDYLICRFIGSRWVAERMKQHQPPPITVPGCVCQTIPTTLYLTMAPGQSGNTPGDLPNLTLVWTGATALGTNQLAFQSTQTFTTSDKTTTYGYIFACYGGLYGVQAVLLSGNSSQVPGQGSNILYSFASFTPGNTCGPPFVFTKGRAPSGNLPYVTINIHG